MKTIKVQEKKKPLTTSVRYTKGVGPKMAGVLNRLGLATAEDVLYYLPRRYEDRSCFKAIADVKPHEIVTIKGRVLTFGVRRSKKGMNIFQLAVGDDTGKIYCVWFNCPFMKKFFRVGQKIIVYGKAEKYSTMQIHQPEYEILDEEDPGPSVHIGRIVPVYSSTQDLTQRFLRTLVKRTLDDYGRGFQDILPTKVRAKHKLVDITFAIHNIHFPHSFDNLKKSYKRLVFEEFFLLQLAIAFKKKDSMTAFDGIMHKSESLPEEMLKELIPFELTRDQSRVMREIAGDMKAAKPMNRLLEGDVGSGKTVVALYGLLLTVKNGFQGTVMAPTEILAEQHYMNLSRMLMGTDINVALLIGSLKKGAREAVLSQIKSGEADIVVGTHALIEDGVEFKKLGLAVIDEQHKFGVSQRAILRKKGNNCDVLVMTATPIPRTLALTVYGDLDISTLRHLPSGRRPVSTYWVEEESRRKVYSFLKEEIKKGRQAYVVYPKIEGTQKSSMKAAVDMYGELKDNNFKEFEVGLIHGRMRPDEKDAVMEKFRKKKIDLLVSTVVIEVGIDVPNATVMFIENAERFGLSQLHQLRGRIGRGEHQSYCILLGAPQTERALRRLKAMTETSDGFQIAEEDLELRGPGDLFGTRQHGLPEIRFGSIIQDMDIMELARKEAFQMVGDDPGLDDFNHVMLKNALRKRFRGKLDLVRVG